MRQMILDAAVKLFQAKGYINTSMDEIAESVGLTKGGLYHYVEKKGDLLKDIHNQILDTFLERVGRAMEGGGSPENKVGKWMEAHASVTHDYLGHMKVFFTEIDNYSEEMLLATSRKRQQAQEMLIEILQAGMSQGKIRADINPRIVSFLLLGMMNWLYIWYRPNGPLSLDEILSNMKGMVTGGLEIGRGTGKGETPHECSAGKDARNVQDDEPYSKV
ncbi:MAG: TetR/AcrR family transcriptional regulator [Deltaproteobacteria bacterium]|nr:TetR/AcrR family transcriptional regulator [Deltaproteobacteria bacterium]